VNGTSALRETGLEFEALQKQFITAQDASAVIATVQTNQAIWRYFGFALALAAANDDRGDINYQLGTLGRSSGSRERISMAQQVRLDT
jgi:hypothetical protein